MKPTLVIAYRTYSSWSFRPWILMRHFGIAFDEVVAGGSRTPARMLKCLLLRPESTIYKKLNSIVREELKWVNQGTRVA